LEKRANEKCCFFIIIWNKLLKKKIRQSENSENSETLYANKVVQLSSKLFEVIHYSKLFKTILCWCKVSVLSEWNHFLKEM